MNESLNAEHARNMAASLPHNHSPQPLVVALLLPVSSCSLFSAQQPGGTLLPHGMSPFCSEAFGGSYLIDECGLQGRLPEFNPSFFGLAV